MSLTAFNPFIPLDDKNSSLPAAFFEVAMENTAAFPIDYTAAFSVRNPFSRQTRNRFVRRDGWSGLAFWQEACGEDAPEYGELTLGHRRPGRPGPGGLVPGRVVRRPDGVLARLRPGWPPSPAAL